MTPVASQKPLKYLFTAIYNDGSTYKQTADDKSLIDPEKRSQFFDVLQLAEKKTLIAFTLAGEGHEYGVDLRDGHFEIDGVPFRMHETEEYGFELIFFRQHTHSFNQTREKDVEVSHDIVYRMGWKLKGNQTYQRVMQID
jgi:hypothetical protein